LNEKEPPDRGINRTLDVTPVGCVAVAVPLIGGIVIGWAITAALDISGVAQILICSAAVFVLSWCVLGALFLSKR